jgi:hypothetical protein
MAFQDLGDRLGAGLSLPYKGKTYRIPAVDAKTGLRLQRLTELAAQAAKAAEDGGDGDPLDMIALDDDEEIDLYRDVLGPACEEMLADGVPFDLLKIAAITMWLHTTVNQETAEEYWNAAGTPDPEALAGNRATRRRAARSTRQQGSAPGTTRTRTPKATAKGTPGRKSSSTGRS